MAEHRYVLIGADRSGPFFEQRSDDAAELLRERDRLAPPEGTHRNGDSGTVLAVFEVIDNDAVDGAPDGGSRGEMMWCEACLAEPVLAKPGDESLCGKCEDNDRRAS